MHSDPPRTEVAQPQPPIEPKIVTPPPEPKIVTPPPAIVIDAGVEVEVVEAKPDAAVPAVVVVHPRPHVAQHEPAQPSGPPGFITIDSTPVYAVIYIDGRKIGETPLVHISVAPGKHSVRAVSGSGSTRNLSIQIDSGKTAPVRRIEW